MSQNFKNEKFSIDLDEASGCVVSASVELSPETVDAIKKQTIKSLKKDVSIPGFRKGKVPNEIIMSRYESAVEKGLRTDIIRASCRALHDVAKKPALSESSFRQVRIDSLDKNGAKVFLKYETFPQVPSVDLDKISIPESLTYEEASVSDEEMNAGLENVAHFFATKTPVERESKEGDFVSLSLHVTEEAQKDAPPVPIFENKYFKLSQNDMSDVFKDKFLGVKAGAQIVEKVHSEDIKSFLRGDKLIFTVNSVIEVSVPELDDEKARQLQAESLEDLKSKLKIQLTNKAKGDLHRERLSAIERALADSVDFDIPESLLKERREAFIREKLLNARLIQYCSDEELESKKELLKEEALTEAVRVVKLSFLIQAVFQQEKLEISREELQFALELCSRERFGPTPPKNELSNEVLQELVTAARERLIYQKVMDHILAKCCPNKTAVAAP